MNIIKTILMTISVFALTVFLFSSCAGTDKKESPDIGEIITKIDGEPVVPRRANTIYIEPFINATHKKEITRELMTRLRESINRERRLASTDSPDTADLILRGKITGFEIQNMSFNAVGVPEKKRMRITAAVKLIEREGARLIFFEKAIQAFKEYSDTIPPITDEQRAFQDVVIELSRRITSKTITGWYTDRMTPVERGKK